MSGRFEGYISVRRRGDDHDRGLANWHFTDPMHNAHPTNLGPAIADFTHQSFESANQVFLVGLVGQLGDSGPPVGMITGRSTEENHRAAVWLDGPPIGILDGWFLCGYRKPGIARWPARRLKHGRSLGARAGPAITMADRVATIGAVGEGTYEDGPFEGELLPAQDRLWRHPAERGAEQAAANLEARRTHGRRWPGMLMSFVAGCTVVGLAWLLQEEDQAPVEVFVTEEVVAPEPSIPDGPLSFDEWANDVAEANRHSVLGLRLGGDASHDLAQAIMFSTDGHLITSAHALIGAEDIRAEVPGGAPIPAQFVASDEVSGIAVLKINAPNLPPPLFGDDRQVLVSDRLVALANHGENTDSLARTVDVLHRDFVAATANGDMLSGLFRLSDDLDDEWSGAAVLEESGDIVAMTVQGRDGRHYAVPISTARKAAQQLIDDGVVEHRAWLGVEMSPISQTTMDERSLLGGMLISRVYSQTPAARGGLLAGDIIVGAGPINVLDRQDLVEFLATLSPGDEVEFRFSRATRSEDSSNPPPEDVDSEIVTTMVTVGARPA